jgi:integrase
MRALADDPERIRRLHGGIAEETPNIANGAMRLLRSIHRHACKSDPALRADWGPTRLIVFKKERVSDDALPFAEMPQWWRQIQDMRERNPITAAFHVINLLTGSRPEVLSRLKWPDINVRARTLTLRRTKTRIDVVLPLSMQIVAELRRARDAGRILHSGNEHVFPAASGGGHLSQWREQRNVLSHRGYELRRCYRTILREIGADEQSEHLLMGHSAKNVNQRYVARALLVGSSLRQVQRKASRRIAGLLRA